MQLPNLTVLKFVVACTKLEHLDVTYCNKINEDFLNGALRALRAQGKQKPTLAIYYAMTAIEENIEMSLLASPKIDREIIEEFVAFIQKTPNLLGIDSFLVIILPKNLAINYMLNIFPEFIWQYGKSNNFTPKYWDHCARKFSASKVILPNWKTHVTDILNNLVVELTFEELLQCFPSEVIRNRNSETILKNLDNRCSYEQHSQLLLDEPQQQQQISDKYPPRSHLAMDNIDENNVFEVVLSKAVSKQRSLALRSMIESTGTQFFDATSNPMYNLN